MNRDLLKLLLGSALRHGLTALSSYLVAKNLLQPDHAAGFVANMTTYIADAVPAILSVGMSMIQKYEHHESRQY